MKEVEKIMELLEEMLDESKKGAKVITFPLSPEGYDSVIPEDILKESIELHTRVLALEDKCADFYVNMAKSNITPPQMFQVTMHMECMKDLKNESQRLAGIHEIDMKMLTELANESGAPSVEAYISRYMEMLAKQAIMDMLKDIR